MIKRFENFNDIDPYNEENWEEEEEWQINDIIICVDNFLQKYRLTKNKEYVILSTSNPTANQRYYGIIDDMGDKTYWDNHRFKLKK